jgi:hypothetical protein
LKEEKIVPSMQDKMKDISKSSLSVQWNSVIYFGKSNVLSLTKLEQGPISSPEKRFFSKKN